MSTLNTITNHSITVLPLDASVGKVSKRDQFPYTSNLTVYVINRRAIMYFQRFVRDKTGEEHRSLKGITSFRIICAIFPGNPNMACIQK